MQRCLKYFAVGLLFLGLVSCAGSKWKNERELAKATGGNTWSNFVIKNLSNMDTHLDYDQQMADVRSAYPYASPADKQFLDKVHQRMGRDKARKASQTAERAARARQNAERQRQNNGSYSNGGSSRYSPSGYQSPRQTGPSATEKWQDQQDWNNAMRRIQYGSATRPGNPYVR